MKKYNQYDLTNEYGIGYTSNNEIFYFDLEDYDIIKKYCWHFNGSRYVSAYKSKQIKEIYMHRLVMNAPKDMEVDHVNHNKFDNRKSNLRLVTRQQNAFNRTKRSDNTSGTVGVIWHKRDKLWIARINIQGRRCEIGRFKNKDDAIKARKKAEIIYYGEYRYREEHDGL